MVAKYQRVKNRQVKEVQAQLLLALRRSTFLNYSSRTALTSWRK